MQGEIVPVAQPSQEVQTIETESVEQFKKRTEDTKQKIEIMNEFIRSQMKRGADYGQIPGFGNKNTLFKAGAEKLEQIFGLTHEYEELKNNIDPEDKEIVMYRYKCKLYKKGTNIQLGEGIGSANSKEPNRRNQNVYGIMNTIDKIAQKRAFVAAIISVCGVSNQFTQDLEDFNDTTTKTQTTTPPINRICQTCQCEITAQEAEFSARTYKKRLCRTCQKKETKTAEQQ